MDVRLKTNQGRAIVEGKTGVPFKTLVQLVMQRKVSQLVKKSGNEPIILDSDLLTSIASAPQESRENHSHLVLVTMGVGVLTGVFAMSILELFLGIINISFGRTEYLIIAASLVGLCVVAAILQRIKRRGKADHLTENMEKLAALLSK